MLLALCFGCTGCATFDPAAAAAGTSSKIAISGHLPQATLGSPYNAVVTVSGGAAPYHFATIAGQFPPGLTINSASGSISGTPKTEGFFNFVLSVADNSENFKGLRILGIGVRKRTRGVAVAVLPFSVDLASGASHQFEAMVSNTGNSSVTWAVSAGKISTTGLFTAPNVTSAKLIQLTATSKADPTRRGVAVINVSPAVAPATLSMAANNLPEASEGAPYSAALHVSGGAAPYRWKVASGALPSGFELDAVGGLITGLTQETGKFSFAATVSDSSGQSVSRKLTLDVTASNAGAFDGPAELPRVYVKSSLADTPAPGAVHVVKSGGNLQAALDSAKCGDTISLEAGGTFSGKVVLRAKNCDDNHWIIVRTSAPDSALPPEGSRLTPCYAGVAALPGRPAFQCSSESKVLAKIVYAQSANGPILLADGANHYRLLGLEITRASSKNTVSNLITTQVGGSSDHIIFDRMWLHGTAQDETTRGVMLLGTNMAVVDSFFSDFHCISTTGSCTDAQAIAGGLGDRPMGPYKIVNNYLEASGENVIFGGGEATRTPEDIEIRRNFFFKPLIWMRGQPGFVGGRDGHPFIVKNHFELKNAVRVLFEANVLENTWGGFGQAGFSILLTPKNQGGNCPLCVVHDITIRYVTISHVGSGMQIANAPSATGDLSQGGWNQSIHDLIISQLNGTKYAGNGFLFQESNSSEQNPLRDVVIDHVTGISDNEKSPVLAIGNAVNHPLAGFKWTNSIFTAGGIGVMTTGGGNVNCAYSGFTGGPLGQLDRCFKDYTFAGNVLIGAVGAWPKDNHVPASVNAVGFANTKSSAIGGLQLQSASPYADAGMDGKAPGADIAAVTAAIAGVAP